MADDAKTKIVFSGGAEVVVVGSVTELRDDLFPSEPGYVQLRRPDDQWVAISTLHIAYLEPAGRQRTGKATFG